MMFYADVWYDIMYYFSKSFAIWYYVLFLYEWYYVLLWYFNNYIKTVMMYFAAVL